MPDTPSAVAASPAPPVARSLSKADFQAAVLALDPRVAVFDCDGTLWSGDAGSGFMGWTMDNGLLSAEKTGWLRARYELYNRGEVNELEICGDMVTCYAGLSVRAMQEAAAVYFRQQIEPNIFPELRELVSALQERGTVIWAVSSTNDWVIAEGVRRFGIPPERVLAARVAVEGDTVTARLLDVPTDEGKVQALRRAGVVAPDAVFGNSVHDAAMLTLGRRAFPVNPTPALQRRAEQENWSVYWPAAVRPLP